MIIEEIITKRILIITLCLKNKILEKEYITQPIQLMVIVSFNTPELQNMIDGVIKKPIKRCLLNFG